MKIGFVGCGKLGLPVALTVESRGHEVKGYDVSNAPREYLEKREIPYQEAGLDELLATTKMEMVSLEELCQWAEILFLAPQTPHGKQYEGDTRVPETRADFDYSYLKQCVTDVNHWLKKPTVCAVISTVLPGTIEREVKPLIGPNFRLVYEPLFIAMGTVKQDFLNPEFVLMGVDDPKAADELEAFYGTIHQKPIFKTGIKEAEAIKVSYNTFITTKTVLANLWGELAHKLDFNVDELHRAWSMATDRLLSPKYLKAGMGDGGGCHPRDNIALSFVAEQCGLSFDYFDSLMKARENHCEWLAELVIQKMKLREARRCVVLGRAFKPGTNIETGSPANLLANLLREKGVAVQQWDPHIDWSPFSWNNPATVFVLATQHEEFKHLEFPTASVVIDPFGYLPPQKRGIEVVRVGRQTFASTTNHPQQELLTK